MSGPGSKAAVRQLVFIDRQVPDLPRLMAGLAAGTRAYLLDAERDALAQIADGLAQHGPVEAVHIVAHGSPGVLHFSSGTVSGASLTQATEALSRIAAALAPDGDLLLWACAAGRGPKGKAFLDALALATGVNVAAATHPVGGLAQGGSWDLDAAVGPAAARAPFTAAAQAHYAGLLQAAPVLGGVAATAAYTENAIPKVLSNGLTVTASTNLVSATVRISKGFFFGDVLAADTTGTFITWSFDAANATLTLTGSDTAAHYQQVLQSVSFASTSDNPTDLGLYTARTIDWQVNDGSAASVSLLPHVDYGAGTSPVSVAIGDLNGDGKLDLAVANLNSNNVSVLLGNGDGTFGAATNFTAGFEPLSVAIADLNGDGKLDLAVANFSSNNVSVLLGNGDGTFGAATNFAAGSDPLSVAIADLNGDGKLDLAVANFSSNNVSVLLGNGDGTFGAATNFAAGVGPRSVAIGDLDGDGKLDLAVANLLSDNVSVLLGNGSGGFGAAANFTVGIPLSVAIGDLDGDGKLDLAVANVNSTNVSVLLGNGDGTFGAATNFATGTSPASVAIGDLDGDGKLDLAVANEISTNVSVLRGNGDGTFGAATNFTVGGFAYSVAIGDLNGVGGLDLAVATGGPVSVLLNSGTNMSDFQHTAVAITAVNDVPLFAGLDNNPHFVNGGPVVLLDGNATVSDAELDAANNYSGASLTLARHNGASPDDVFGASGSLSFTGGNVLVGATDVGTFTDAGGTLAITFNANATSALVDSVLEQITYAYNPGPPIASAQIDYTFSDGNAGAQGSGGPGIAHGRITVAIDNSGAPPFTPPAFELSGFAPGGGGWTSDTVYPRILADVNGDGLADIVGFGAAGTYVSAATGGGHFAPATLAMSGFAALMSAGGWFTDNQYPRTAADVNGDGLADIVGFGASATYVALATGNGQFSTPTLATTAFTYNVGGWTSEDQYPRTVGDVDGDGRADIIGFGSAGTFVALATGGASFAAPFLSQNAFGSSASAGGWSSENTYPRSIADVNGDGKADIVGFASDGVYVSLATGDGHFAPAVLALAGFGASAGAGGWISQDLYPRELADVNGDGRADIVGFGSSGVFVAHAKSDGTFDQTISAFNDFGASPSAGGWTSFDAYPRLMGDVTGDHRADIVGFGSTGVFVSPSHDFLVI